MNKLQRLLRYDLPLHFVLLLTHWLPDNVIFLRLRGALARPFLGGCGRNLRLGRHITFYNPSQIFLGRDVYLAYGCWLMADAPITLGDEVMFGPYCVVASSNHTRQAGSFRYGTPAAAPITIERGVWLAANVTVTAGAKIGAGTLVAANAAVQGELPPLVMAGGVPAKVLRDAE